MKGIVVTTENKIYVQDFAEPLYKTVGKVIGGWIELVHPLLLEPPFCMIVNEEGLLEQLPPNLVGCFLYKTADHGWPIAGNAVFLKETRNEDGENCLCGLNEEEIAYLTKKFKRILNTMGVQTP